MRVMFRVSSAVGFLATAVIASAGPQQDQRTFATPEEGARALIEAAQKSDKAALHQILGTDCDHFLTGDDARDGESLKKFAAGAKAGCICAPAAKEEVFLEIGPDQWPFPIPLEKQDGRWFFDTQAGREEIISRHIGSDELHAIGVCRAFAQQSKPRPELTSLLAQARTDDPAAKSGDDHACHGYVFKAIGGKGGKALVAYPEQWGRSGVMTFAATADGKVYERDLGEKTTEIATGIAEFKPNHHWKVVRDQGVQDGAHNP